MFLSNPVKYFLGCGLVCTIFSACGFWQNDANQRVPLVPEAKSDVPFSTKEPDTFQGEFVRGSGENLEHSYFARKGGKWRLDAENSGSVLQTDNTYKVLHDEKIYAVMPVAQSSAAAPGFVNDLTIRLLRTRDYTEFEDLGRDGDFKKYRAVIAESGSSEILIDVDTVSGMIVKQEFRSLDANWEMVPLFTFELRNLSLEVDDSVFEIPKRYRKVSPAEFAEKLKRKNNERSK